MKMKYLGTTVILAAVIILLGIVGLPIVYHLFFNEESIIDGQSGISDYVAAGPDLFLENLIYPVMGESTPLSAEQIEYYLTDSKSLMDPMAYERMFELAGLPYDETYWDSLSAVDGAENYFVLELDGNQWGGNSSLTVMLEDFMPVFLSYKSSSVPSPKEMETAVSDLEAMKNSITNTPASQASELFTYVAKIEPVFAGSEKYKLWLNRLYPSLSKEVSLNQELSGDNSLWDCCCKGVWEVYSSDQSAVLVCRLRQGYMILYYDAAAGDFCGFHLVMGGS